MLLLGTPLSSSGLEEVLRSCISKVDVGFFQIGSRHLRLGDNRRNEVFDEMTNASPVLVELLVCKLIHLSDNVPSNLLKSVCGKNFLCNTKCVLHFISTYLRLEYLV